MGEIDIENQPDDLNDHWIDPKTGDPKKLGKVSDGRFTAPDTNPWVLLIAR